MTVYIDCAVCFYQSLDLHQAAQAHLYSSLLKIKGIAESPRLPSEIKPVPKPNLSEEERSALHNVTSGLCNRKQVKDVVEQAIMGTCIALRVPMPEKKGKIKTNNKDVDNPKSRKDEPRKDEPADDDLSISSDNTSEDELERTGEPVLLKRRSVEVERDNELDDWPSNAENSSDDDEEVFEGFSDSDAEERAFSRCDDLLGGSSDSEDDSEDDASESEEDSRDRAVRRVRALPDDMSISSAEESEADFSEAESLSPPPAKKTRIKVEPGRSAFLPTLMGGYVSGSESASDVDVAPSAKKNRRGQRARQAIWEKKYGDKAKHKQNPNPKQQDGRDQGWDMQRGAVDPADADAKPWKKGIRNPFEKNTMHPERMRHIEHGRKQQDRSDDRDRGRGPPRAAPRESYRERPVPKIRQEQKRDDTGPLHPSWAAAKKAKEEGQKVAFQGRKITFD